MANKMLIDATHPEETRVVVLRGNRVEEFDFESASRRQLRGNIYLAKVTRVEPSLQAAFVDYGGNRHGFLAFSEIHPDYYQIPIADRQALIDEEERAHRDAEAEADRRAGMRRRGPQHRPARRSSSDVVASEPVDGPAGDEEHEIPAGEPRLEPTEIAEDRSEQRTGGDDWQRFSQDTWPDHAPQSPSEAETHETQSREAQDYADDAADVEPFTVPEHRSADMPEPPEPEAYDARDAQAEIGETPEHIDAPTLAAEPREDEEGGRGTPGHPLPSLR